MSLSPTFNLAHPGDPESSKRFMEGIQPTMPGIVSIVSTTAQKIFDTMRYTAAVPIALTGKLLSAAIIAPSKAALLPGIAGLKIASIVESTFGKVAGVLNPSDFAVSQNTHAMQGGHGDDYGGDHGH